jgi:SMODS and SLOG-associating 2TM effector domain 3
MVIPLLNRFPRLRPPESHPVIPQEKRTPYPALAAEFEVIDRVLTPAFDECDVAALRYQHRYRRQQVLVLLGSALVAGLGGLQAAFPRQWWPGALLAALGLLLAASSRIAKEQSSFDNYLSERVRAEGLRSLYFRYLSRTGAYDGDEAEIALRRAVLAVKRGKEPR